MNDALLLEPKNLLYETLVDTHFFPETTLIVLRIFMSVILEILKDLKLSDFESLNDFSLKPVVFVDKLKWCLSWIKNTDQE